MKSLNEQATEIFCRLTQHTNENGYLKIINDPFMSLTIERIGEDIITPWGTATIHDFCNYRQQNGDLVKDHKMCFIMADKRGEGINDYHLVKIFPYTLQSETNSFYQNSLLFKGNILDKFQHKMQYGLAVFANRWLEDLKKQGFIEAAAKSNS